MRIIYTKPYTNYAGRVIQPGKVADCTKEFGRARIREGVAQPYGDDTETWRPALAEKSKETPDLPHVIEEEE